MYVISIIPYLVYVLLIVFTRLTLQVNFRLTVKLSFVNAEWIGFVLSE